MTSLKPVIEQEGVSSGSFRMMSTPHQVDREAGGQLLQCTRSHATKDLNGHVRSSSGQDHTTIRYCCSQSMNSKMKNAKNKCRDQKNKLSTRLWSSTASIPSRCMPQLGIWRQPQSENSQIALRVTQVYSFISELIRRWRRDLTTKSRWSVKLGRPHFNDQPNSICYSVGLPNLLTFFGLSFCY